MSRRRPEQERSTQDGCTSPLDLEGCCQVEAVVTVDERGQMVLPKDVREKMGIGPKEKLAVVTWGVRSSSPFVALIRAQDMARWARSFLGPVLDEMHSEESKDEGHG